MGFSVIGKQISFSKYMYSLHLVFFEEKGKLLVLLYEVTLNEFIHSTVSYVL